MRERLPNEPPSAVAAVVVGILLVSLVLVVGAFA
jgi:hypothetical protein